MTKSQAAPAPVIAENIRRAIEDLIYDCAHAIDDDRLEDWPKFFTADCHYEIIARENYARGHTVGIMTCTSRGMLEDRVLAARKANIYEPHVYRHLVSAVRVRAAANGVYSVESGYAVVRTMQEGDVSIFSAGKCIDEIVFANGAPRFKSRKVICDSARIHTLIVFPI